MDAKVDRSRGLIKEGEATPEKRHPSTPRMERLKQVFMDEKPTICAERNVLYTESYQETEALQPVLRQARAFEKTLDEMPIWIRDEDLIVSNLASKPGGSPGSSRWSSRAAVRRPNNPQEAKPQTGS
jgi:pyruvate-formate lyase